MQILFLKLFSTLLLVVSLIACQVKHTPPVQDLAIVLEAASRNAQLVDVNRLVSDIEWMANDARQGRRAGTTAEDEVGIWLIQRYQQLGLQPFRSIGLHEYADVFEIKSKRKSDKIHLGKNIIGVLQGAERLDEYIVVSAHYDHLGLRGDRIYNGADDNASGVAAMLELARIMSNASTRPKKSIVFIAFSAEEQNLQGSRNFCNHVSNKGLTDKMTALNFEMFGAIKGQGKYIHIWHSEQTSEIVDAVYKASEQIKFPLLVTHAAGFRADARVLQDCGINSTTMDVAGGAHFKDNHPHYHRASDHAVHIDVNGLQAATKVGLIAIWQLANR